MGGAVDLNGLTATFNLGFTPNVGDSFTLINKTSSGAIIGTLNGLAEGTTFNVGGVTFTISYMGGTGNDLVVTVADVTPPTVSSFSVNASDGSYKVGDTITVVATMDEAITAGSTFAVTLDTGAIINLTAATNGTSLTGNYTVSLNEASNDLTVSSYTTGTVTDLANNALASTTLPSGNNIADTKNIIIDGVLPTAVITISDTALKVGDMATVTLTFSEAVTSFTTTDVNVANGVLANLTTSDGGITWTATLIPNSNVTDTSNTLTLDLTGISDLAGNSGVGSVNSGNYTLDTIRPALASAITLSDTALKLGDTATVTFGFTEAVSGFTTADVSLTNGVLTNLTTSDGGITWTATLTPNSNVTDTSNMLTLDLTGISDLAGNSGVGSVNSGNYTIDTTRPTASIVVVDSALTLGDTSLVTITFSEAVNGFTSADLSVDNGSLSNVSSNDGGITWTATLTPALSVIDNSNVIRLSNNNVQDSAGNTGSGDTLSNNYTINTDTPPSASSLNQTLDYIEDTTTPIDDIIITDPDADSFTATVSMADGNSSNGSLSASSGHGEVYNATTGVWSVTGSLADVNAALAALSFVPAPNKHSTTSAAVLISDGVNASLTGMLQFNGITVNDAPLGIPSLIGILEQGQIITADTSAVTDADGISGTYSYVWKANSETIKNANAATYQLTQAEVGKTITVQVSYTDNDNTLETVTSLASVQVANINDGPAAYDDTAIAVELGGIDSIPGINPSGNVLTNDSDMDAGDAISVIAIANGVVGGSIEGKYGRLHLNSDGSYTYIVNNNNPLVDALNNGDSLVDSFNYTITDSLGLFDNAYLKITIQGQTDAAIDQDGISAVIENTGGDGDANNDGIPDAEQSNVTNLPLISAEDFALGSQAPATSFGALIVGDLSSEDGEVSLNANTEIDNVKVLSKAEAEAHYGAMVAAELAQISQDLLFTGLLNYTIKATGNNSLTDLDPTRSGTQTRLVIALPEGVTTDTYYKIGLVPTDSTPHVYAYMADGNLSTYDDGAEFIDSNHDGDYERIVITFTDGATGDDDLLANNQIMDPGFIGQAVTIRHTIIGTPKADQLLGTQASDNIIGLAGADLILGGSGDDWIRSNTGNDTVRGGLGNDSLFGGSGDDIFSGRVLGDDQYYGGTGYDTVDYRLASEQVTITLGQSDAQNVSVNSGNDKFNSIENLNGSAYDDSLMGNNGRNQLLGRGGGDYLEGLGRADVLIGGRGNDSLSGGLGHDTLTGGAGNDHFIFNSALAAAHSDIIIDFKPGTDVIELSASVFTVFAGQIGQRVSLSEILSYEAETGSLSYDAGNAAVTLAILGVFTHPMSLGNDFLITT